MDNRKQANWQFPSIAQKLIDRNTLPGAVICRTSDNGSTNTKNKITTKEHIVINYSHRYNAYIIWNASIHRFLHNGSASVTFNCGADAEARLEAGILEDEIITTYKRIRQTNFENCVEKVLLIGTNALFEFLQHYEDYLYPDVAAIPAGKSVLYTTPADSQLMRIDGKTPEQIERSRIAATRTKRDPEFRRKILAKYHSTCIVCGSTEEKQLQAAHIESVQDGGSDSADNGYCLCANHHLLYDAGLLDIDKSHNTFVCHSESEKQMPWYLEAQKRNFQLVLKEENAE